MLDTRLTPRARRLRRRRIAFAAGGAGALVIVAILVAATRDARPDPPELEALRDTATTGHTVRPELIESSGAAMSLAQPGVLFTINDSGNEPVLYATDVAGGDAGAWRVTGATNIDWEALALGPCGRAATAAALAASGGRPPRPDRLPDRGCVYVGETGDNDAQYPTRAVYRVPEPLALRRPGMLDSTPRAERLVYRYVDGPRDVEAMYVAPDGTVFLITKRATRTMLGQRRPALVYALPAALWEAASSEQAPVVAALVDSLPTLIPGSETGRTITDASLSPGARFLAVRTYEAVFIYRTDPETGRVDPRSSPRACAVGPLQESQGEGVAWFGTTGALVFTGEGAAAPVHVAVCPVPRAEP